MKFYRPQNIISNQKYTTRANAPYPLYSMQSDDYANLVYWVYKTEIQDGPWSKNFDDIAIMRATRDQGKDCVLYKNGIMTGAIQCKHSINPKGVVSDNDFLKEFTKFLLYAVVPNSKIKIDKKFVYYVASSGNFTEGCITLIQKSKTQLILHPKYKTHIDGNIAEYKSLKNLDFNTVENQLTSLVSKIDIKRISGDEISKLLHKTIHLATVQTFFDTKTIISEEASKTVIEGIQALKQKILPGSKPRPKQITAPSPYIQRDIESPDDDLFHLIAETENSLVDCILKYKRSVLLGWGLSGKSTEMAHAAHLLSSSKYTYHVFFRNLGLYKGEDLDKYIPDIKLRPENEIILFLDGLDEIPPESYTKAIQSIIDFEIRYPQAMLIISSRNNSYSVYENSQYNTLPGFTILKIKDLSRKIRDNYLSSLAYFDLEFFYHKLEKTHLDELLGTPFYLIKLAKKFQESGTLFKNKGELFEQTISDAVRDDVCTYFITDREQKEKNLRKSLDKLACIMEIRGTNYFSVSDLEEIFTDQDTVSLIKKNGKLIKNNQDQTSWHFFHHNVQEYLTAKKLSHLHYQALLKIITSGAKNDQVRPALVNTISFLIGILSKTDPTRQQLIDLMVRNDPALLMKFEADHLDENLRTQIFQKIFNFYKQLSKPINTFKFSLSELASFSQTAISFDFLINELDPSGMNQLNNENVLDILIHYDFSDFPRQSGRLKGILDNMLPSVIPLKFAILNLLFTQYDYNEAEFEKMFTFLKPDTNTHIHTLLFKSMIRFKQEVNYRDFLISETILLAREDFDSWRIQHEPKRSGSESMYLKDCLKNLSDIDSVIAKINMLSSHFDIFKGAFTFKILIYETIQQAAKFKNDKLENLIVELFAMGIIKHSISVKPNDIWLKYFNKTGTQLKAVKRLINTIHGLNYQITKPTALLADQAIIDYIIIEFSDQHIDVDAVKSLQWQLKECNPELMEYFNGEMNKITVFDLPKVIDQKLMEKTKIERILSCLYDKQQYLQEVKDLFKKHGGHFLRWEDVANIHERTSPHDDFYYWLYDSFDFKNISDRLYSFQEIEDFTQNRFDELMPSRIYNLLNNHPSYQLSDTRIKFLVSWCTKIEDGLDFSKEIVAYGYKMLKFTDEQLFAYFVQRFHLKSFEKETYIKMLEYVDGTSTNEKTNQFVESVVTNKMLKTAVLKNIAGGNLHGTIFRGHIELSIRYNWIAIAPDLIVYLKNSSTYGWEKILDAYIELNGNTDLLFPLLDTKDAINLFHLVKYLKQTDEAKTRAVLKNHFTAKPEPEKKVYARELIKLGEIEAFNYYLTKIYNFESGEDIIWTHENLNISYSNDFAEAAIDLLFFSKKHQLLSRDMADSFYIASNLIRNFAKDFKNYPSLQHLILAKLKEVKADKNGEYDAVISFIESELESLNHQFLLNNGGTLSLAASIKIVNEIIGT